MAKGLVKGADKVADVGKGLKNKGFDNDNLGKYSIIESPKNAGPGKNTTCNQRQKILQENMRQNGGVIRSDGDAVF